VAHPREMSTHAGASSWGRRARLAAQAGTAANAKHSTARVGYGPYAYLGNTARASSGRYATLGKDRENSV